MTGMRIEQYHLASASGLGRERAPYAKETNRDDCCGYNGDDSRRFISYSTGSTTTRISEAIDPVQKTISSPHPHPLFDLLPQELSDICLQFRRNDQQLERYLHLFLSPQFYYYPYSSRSPSPSRTDPSTRIPTSNTISDDCDDSDCSTSTTTSTSCSPVTPSNTDADIRIQFASRISSPSSIIDTNALDLGRHKPNLRQKLEEEEDNVQPTEYPYPFDFSPPLLSSAHPYHQNELLDAAGSVLFSETIHGRWKEEVRLVDSPLGALPLGEHQQEQGQDPYPSLASDEFRSKAKSPPRHWPLVLDCNITEIGSNTRSRAATTPMDEQADIQKKAKTRQNCLSVSASSPSSSIMKIASATPFPFLQSFSSRFQSRRHSLLHTPGSSLLPPSPLRMNANTDTDANAPNIELPPLPFSARKFHLFPRKLVVPSVPPRQIYPLTFPPLFVPPRVPYCDDHYVDPNDDDYYPRLRYVVDSKSLGKLACRNRVKEWYYKKGGREMLTNSQRGGVMRRWGRVENEEQRIYKCVLWSITSVTMRNSLKGRSTSSSAVEEISMVGEARVPKWVWNANNRRPSPLRRCLVK